MNVKKFWKIGFVFFVIVFGVQVYQSPKWIESQEKESLENVQHYLERVVSRARLQRDLLSNFLHDPQASLIREAIDRIQKAEPKTRVEWKVLDQDLSLVADFFARKIASKQLSARFEKLLERSDVLCQGSRRSLAQLFAAERQEISKRH